MGSVGSKRRNRCQTQYPTGANAIGVSGCPEPAACTASIASVRIVLMHSVSGSVAVRTAGVSRGHRYRSSPPPRTLLRFRSVARFLGVPAELLAHRGQRPVGERVRVPEGEPDRPARQTTVIPPCLACSCLPSRIAARFRAGPHRDAGTLRQWPRRVERVV
jgi:hypothetical protein